MSNGPLAGAVCRTALLAAVMLATVGSEAAAQASEAGGAERAPLPIEIEAEQGIEWFREEKVVYARGNARAVRGDLVVTADVLGARYRDRADGSQEVWQLDAAGNVTIAAPGRKASADRGVYNLDTETLRLYGKPSRITSNGDTLTATRELEVATRTQVIVARGDAAAQQGDRLIKADEITAFLDDGPNGGARLTRLEAERDVVVITPQEVIRGHRGTYNVTAGTATVTGDVRITRGANQLSGCRGELDLNAGVSRLTACDGGERPVRGLILPGGGPAGTRAR